MDKRKAMIQLFLAVFIDMIGFGIVIPILPFVAENYGADGFMLGMFVAMFSLMQFLFAPFWGMLSDKIGRRPVLLIGIAGTALSFFIFGVADSLLVLFLSRAVQGIFTAASMPTAQAYLADIIDPKDRAKSFGQLGMAFGLGFAFGPALGGLLAENGLLFPALVAGGLSTLNFIGAWIWLPETYKPTGKIAERKILDFGKLADAVRHPSIGSLIVTFAVISFAFSGMEATFALFGQERAGLDAASNGIVFMLVGLIMTIMQGFGVGFVTKRIGERKTLLLGLILGVIAYLMIAISTSFIMLMAATAVLATGFGLTFPSVFALISINTRWDEQGETIGLSHGVGALARVVGPLVAGWIFVNVGVEWPYYVCAAVGFLALLIAYYRVKMKPPTDNPAPPAQPMH